MPSADSTVATCSTDTGGQEHWFKRLRRHAIFPVFCFIAASSVIKENYPFSHFSMYARPSSKPHSYCYLADGDGAPLPLLYHTGVTASQLTKMFGHYRGPLEKDKSLTEAEIDAGSAIEVLKSVRKLNTKRPTRPLPDEIRLIRVTINYGDDEFIETQTSVAKNP